MELHLGHVRPSEGIHRASRYLSLELWVGSVSGQAAFKAKRQSKEMSRAKQSPMHGLLGDADRYREVWEPEGCRRNVKKEHITEAK